MALEKVPLRRLSRVGHVSVPRHTPGLAAIRIILVLVAVGAVLIVVAADDLGIRFVMGTFAVLLMALLLYLTLMARQVRDGVVRIDTRAPGLHFRPTAWPTVGVVVLLLLCALAGVAGVVLAGPADLISPRRSPAILPVVSVVFLGVILWRLRTPPGLLLTVDGIRGLRGRGELDWAWDDLGDVRVDGPRPDLSLTMRNGYVPVTSSPRYLGSDPNQVAAVLRFFRDHPEERKVLAEGGEAALRRAADVLRPLER